jgi:predicted DCC family thiol-disulfide oxidoreductase YuxK
MIQVFMCASIVFGLITNDHNPVFYFTEDYSESAQECMRKSNDIPEDINDILYNLIRKELEEEDRNYKQKNGH